MKYTILFCLLGLLCAQTLSAQDKIYRKNGDILNVKIIEVDPDLIKYRQADAGDSILFSLEKDKISKVVYSTGKSEVFTDNLRNPELYADQRQKAIKVNFLSPLFGFTQFSYEQLIRPGQSFEIGVGIIGLGRNQELSVNDGETFHRSAGGAFVEGGVKFIKLPNFRDDNTRYSHIMQGSYLRPNAVLGLYGQNVVVQENGKYETERKDVTFGGLTLDLGRQWVFGDQFLLDIYFGLGYAIDNIKPEESDAWSDYAHHHFAILTTGDSGFGMRAGFKIGFLLK